MTSTAQPPLRRNTDALMRLHDLDMLLRDYCETASRGALEGSGFQITGLEQLERTRDELARTIDRRWLHRYESALRRYGRAVVPVKDRVCLGCFVTLPSSASPPTEGSDELLVCESCGRILYWLREARTSG
jgi:predicted  nucleic acid-binding Zn-ribbon protein